MHRLVRFMVIVQKNLLEKINQLMSHYHSTLHQKKQMKY